MDLRILGSVTKTEVPNYRGTDRATPYHVDEVPDTHPANQAFFWYCEHGDQYGSITDLTRGKDLIRIYQELIHPQYFEIVEITLGDLPPVNHGNLLGYDISAGRFSLLGQGLNFNNESHLLNDIIPLLHLVRDFFQAKLNSNGLFDNFSIASYCLECMMALQKLRPGLWENEQVVFNVMGIWRVEE